MNLSTLPDLCLLSIFSKIPLPTQLSLGLVTTRLRTLQLLAHRHQSRLIITDHYHNHAHNQIRLYSWVSPIINPHSIKSIPDHFPHITSLALVYFQSDSFEPIIQLLRDDHWHARLVRLKIRGSLKDNNNNTSF